MLTSRSLLNRPVRTLIPALLLASAVAGPALAAVTPWTKPQLVAALVAAQKSPLKVTSTTPVLTSLANPTAVSAASGNGLISANCQPYGHPALAQNPVPCKFGETASPKGTVVLYGNSHVGNWILPLSAAMKAKSYELDVFMYAGCPATAIDYTKAPFQLKGSDVSSCMTWNTNLPAKVRSLNPKAIFYTGGPEFSALLGTYDAQFATGVKNMMAQMGSAPKFILGTTPSLPAAVPACLSRPTSDATACQLGYFKTSWYSQLMARDQVIATTTTATLIPTFSMFCQVSTVKATKTICPAIVAGIVVYTDTDHTTQEYSKRLATVLSATLAPLVK